MELKLTCHVDTSLQSWLRQSVSAPLSLEQRPALSDGPRMASDQPCWPSTCSLRPLCPHNRASWSAFFIKFGFVLVNCCAFCFYRIRHFLSFLLIQRPYEHQYISELPAPLLDLFISSSSHFCTPFSDRPSRSFFGTPQNKVPILAPFLTLRFWHWESRDTLWLPVGFFYLALSPFETSIQIYMRWWESIIGTPGGS